MTMQPGTCPITDEPAKVNDERVGGGDPPLEFRCPTCGHFYISESAIKMFEIKNPSRTEREAALQNARARAKAGEPPKVLSYDLLSS